MVICLISRSIEGTQEGLWVLIVGPGGWRATANAAAGDSSRAPAGLQRPGGCCSRLPQALHPLFQLAGSRRALVVNSRRRSAQPWSVSPGGSRWLQCTDFSSSGRLTAAVPAALLAGARRCRGWAATPSEAARWALAVQRPHLTPARSGETMELPFPCSSTDRTCNNRDQTTIIPAQHSTAHPANSSVGALGSDLLSPLSSFALPACRTDLRVPII